MPVYIPGNGGGGGTGSGSVTGDFYTKFQSDSRYVHLSGLESINGQKTFLSNAIFADSVEVSGNLSIIGRISAVRTDATFIEVNSNEAGAGVTNSSGGLTVNRGSLIPARIVFSENMSGNSDNRWYLQNGDGFTEKLLYDGIPDSVLFNGPTTVNNDLIVYYDLKIPNQASSGFLVTDINGKIVNSGYNSNSFATISYVTDISSGLQVQIGSILHNGLSGLQGGLSNERYHLTQSQYDNYIGRAEVAGISSNLNSKIQTITGNYSTISLVSTISGSLQTQINNVNTSVNNVTGQFATTILVAGTSGVLQSNINAKVSADILRTEVASISSGLNNTKIGDAPADGTTYGRKNNTWTAIVATSGGSSGPITRSVGFVIDGGSSVPTSGTYSTVEVPFAGTISSWSVIGDISGSAVLNIWKAAGTPPIAANSIVASAKPTLSGQKYVTSSTLSGWNTSISSGDLMTVHLESASLVKRVTVQLKVTT